MVREANMRHSKGRDPDSGNEKEVLSTLQDIEKASKNAKWHRVNWETAWCALITAPKRRKGQLSKIQRPRKPAEDLQKLKSA